MNVKDKVGKIKARREQLYGQYPDGYLFLTTQENDTFNTVGGMTMQVPVENAAVHLQDATHRVATEQEIAKWKEDQANARKRILTTELAKKASHIVHVDPLGNPVDVADKGGKR